MIHANCRTLGALVLAAALCPAAVGAQTVARSFDGLRLLVKPGQTVYVIDTTGREVEGQIIELSSSLVVQVPASGRRELAEGDVRTMRLRGNSLLKGTIWGLGIGAASGSLLIATLGECSYKCGEDVLLGAAIFGAIGAGIGAGVGALRPSYRLVYEKPATAAVTVLPLVTGRQKGVLVSVRF